MRPGAGWALPVIVGVGALVAKVLLSAPQLPTQSAVVAITWLVTASFTAVGLSLLATDVPPANGWACLLMAWSTVPGDLNSAYYVASGWTPLGFVLEPVYLPAGVALALRYPTSRLSGRDRLLVWSLVAVTSPVRLATVLTAGPLPDDFYRPRDATAWWAPYLHDIVCVRAGRGAAAVLLVVASVALVRRAVRARGVSRESVIPLTVIGAVTALAAAADQAIWALDAFRDVSADLVRNLAAALVPVALLADLLRRRSAVATISQRVLAAARTGDLDRTQVALRRALRDPGLRLLAAEDAEWGTPPVDDHRRPPVPPPVDERHVRGDDGQTLARLLLDPRVADDEELVTAAAEAVATGLENARLTLDLRRRNAELLDSRARIVEAGVEQRRRIERDLHDGAQQGFLAVAATLGRASLVQDERLRPLVEEARTGLGAALGDLRRLARGIHPVSLSQGGLAAAVPALCSPFAGRATIDIAPEVSAACADRPVIETTAYYVLAEALTNVARHAPDASVSVHVVVVDGVVHLDVTDDGPGGTHVTTGGGLSGLADRVAALGGELGLAPPSASGTHLWARLPLHQPRRPPTRSASS